MAGIICFFGENGKSGAKRRRQQAVGNRQIGRQQHGAVRRYFGKNNYHQ